MKLIFCNSALSHPATTLPSQALYNMPGMLPASPRLSSPLTTPSCSSSDLDPEALCRAVLPILDQPFHRTCPLLQREWQHNRDPFGSQPSLSCLVQYLDTVALAQRPWAS